MNFESLTDRIDRMMQRGDAWRTIVPSQASPMIEPIMFGQVGGLPPRAMVWVARIDGRVKYHTKATGTGEGCCSCWSGDPPGSQPANDVGEFINFYTWHSVFDQRTWRNKFAGMKQDGNSLDGCSYDPDWIAAQDTGEPPIADYKIGGQEIGATAPTYLNAASYSPGMALNTADWGYDLKWSRKRWNARTNISNTGSPGVVMMNPALHVLMSVGYWRLSDPEFTRCSAEPRPNRIVPFFDCYAAGIHVLI